MNSAWMSTNGISEYRANCLDKNKLWKDNSMTATQKNIKDVMLSHPFFCHLILASIFSPFFFFFFKHFTLHPIYAPTTQRVSNLSHPNYASYLAKYSAEN